VGREVSAESQPVTGVKRPVGRPLEGAEPRDQVTTIRLTRTEKAAARAGAKAEGLTLSRWIAHRVAEAS